MMAERIARLSKTWGHAFVFKGSFDKANRSSETRFAARMKEGLRILGKIKSDLS